MINATKLYAHLRHTEKRTNTLVSQGESASQTHQTETHYLLDLSILNGQNNQVANEYDESAAFLELSEELLEKMQGIMTPENQRAEAAEANEEGGGLKDETRRLTRKLVNARSTTEVQDVLREAFQHMKDAIMAAAMGDKKAMAILRRLQKLVRRSNRKISDLHKEQEIRERQQRAEKKEQEQIAQRLRDELKRALLERKRRERKYLQDKDDDGEDNGPTISGPSIAATEAKIQALAQAMAALSTSPGTGASSGDAGFSDGAAMSGGGLEGADVAGAEAEGEI